MQHFDIFLSHTWSTDGKWKAGVGVRRSPETCGFLFFCGVSSPAQLPVLSRVPQRFESQLI